MSIIAGVRPLTEGTALTTQHLIASSKMRSFNGQPSKIGGWESTEFDNSNTIVGAARSMYSTVLNGNTLTTIGTHKRLYALYGTALTNITPLKTISTAAADSLATLYGTLANNPITTVSGSKTLTIADASAGRLRASDTVTISGAATTNGVPDTDINTAQVVRSVAADGLSFTIIVSTAASSSGSGGGASVVRATGIIEVSKTAHGLEEGQRVKISGAATTGGVTDTLINVEHIIRVTGVDDFDVMTSGTATSSVSAGGGGSTVYYPQIDAGNINELAGQGYGMGLYGMGLYGTALQSSSAASPARVWYHVSERFSDIVLTTAGGQTGLYEWDGDTDEAPVLVSGAPTAINYAFVSNNIVVTFGAGDVENRIKTSDQGDRTNWTSSSTNQVFVDDIEGAGRFISHVHLNGVNLIFTRQQTYTFRYIGLPAIWEIKMKDPAIGIISSMARVVVNGIAYWMGENNFYMWRGSNIEIIPSNSSKQTTLLKHVFENINRSQLSKCFAWHNEKYNEIWFHYPSQNSDEPDMVARLCLQDMSWWPDTFDRLCAEYPNITLQYPRLIDSDGVMYQHEFGNDDDGEAMQWSMTTADQIMGKNNAALVGVVPDSTQDGTINVTIQARRFPQSSAYTFNDDFDVTSTTERIPCASSGRLWRYTFSGEELDQEFTLGQWFEEVQEGAGN